MNVFFVLNFWLYLIVKALRNKCNAKCFYRAEFYITTNHGGGKWYYISRTGGQRWLKYCSPEALSHVSDTTADRRKASANLGFEVVFAVWVDQRYLKVSELVKGLAERGGVIGVFKVLLNHTPDSSRYAHATYPQNQIVKIYPLQTRGGATAIQYGKGRWSGPFFLKLTYYNLHLFNVWIQCISEVT